ncbi:MAG TPA: amidase, partial [Herpetosiphonaceae bacterium]
MLDGYEEYDGLGLAELVRARKTSPEELLAAAVSRAELLNPRLNAIIRRMDNEALRAAEDGLPDGPFRGVPFLIKDLLADYAGAPIHSGSRLLRGYVSRRDSEVVARYKRAGLVIFGKTNTPEFGLLPVTEPLAFGPTRNPWDLGRTPGGSSGGSAAAVAARIVPIASGGDGGGSIRIPASACGLFGMKPTRGRTPVGPFIGEAWSGFAGEHVLTRSVRDSAAMLDATHGPDIGNPHPLPEFRGSWLEAVGRAPKRLRIAVSCEPMLGKAVAPEVRSAFAGTVRLLEELGHQVVEAAPAVERERFSLAFLTVLAAELRADIEFIAELSGVRVRPEDFDASSFGLGLLGQAFSAAELAAALRYLKLSARSVLGFFEEHDVLMTPVLSSL